MAKFINHYDCPACGYTWSDSWDCMVDDDCPQCGKRHISPSESEDEDDAQGPATEVIDLHDGPELQHVVPGVEPVSHAARQIAQEASRRASRRGASALPVGGLWDDVSQRQQELFL